MARPDWACGRPPKEGSGAKRWQGRSHRRRRKAWTSTFGNVRKLPSCRWQARYVGPMAGTTPRHFPSQTGCRCGVGQVPRFGSIKGTGSTQRQGGFQSPNSPPDGSGENRPEANHEGQVQAPSCPPHSPGTRSPSARRPLLPCRPGLVRRACSRHQTSADDAYRLLRTIMNTAVADGMVARTPPSEGRRASPFARATSGVGTRACRGRGGLTQRLRLAALLAAWCQLRRGESWRVDGATLTSTGHSHGDGNIGDAIWWKPLSANERLKAGRRTLTIPPNIMPAVERHLERFVNPEPDGWLFATATGTAVSPRNFNRAWTRARTAAGRPDLHLHDLRHSGLTWAAATGASTADLCAVEATSIRGRLCVTSTRQQTEIEVSP